MPFWHRARYLGAIALLLVLVALVVVAVILAVMTLILGDTGSLRFDVTVGGEHYTSDQVLPFVAAIPIIIGILMLVVVTVRVSKEVFRAWKDGTSTLRLNLSWRYGSPGIDLMLMLLTFLWAMISLTIAVTTIIAAREIVLKNSLSTWGTSLDIIVAFTWGAVANRLLQSLKSNWGGVQSYIEGGDETSKEGAKA